MSASRVEFLTFLLLVLWPAHNAVVAAVGLVSTRPGRPAAGRHHRAAPTRFWVVVPALDEERVIARTVTAALALDAPGTPTSVLVVDDASTDGTPAVLAGLHDERLHVLRREPPEARLGKGEALNAAHRWVREHTAAEDRARTVVGVIDGDGRMPPGSLETVAAYFDEPDVGAVQTQVRIHDRRRLLGLVQDIEFGCVAHAAQGLRDRLGSVGLGGNGQFVRLCVLDRWDRPWSTCLVEDLELGLRLHRAGVRVRYASGAAVSQQGITHPGRLLRQRTRWAHGNLQCARHLPGLAGSREVGGLGLVDFLQYLVSPWLTVPMSLLVAALATVTVGAALGGHAVPGLVAERAQLGTALALWGVVLLLPGLMWALVHRMRLRGAGLGRTVLAGLVYPLFLLLGVIATWWALGRHLRGRRAWSKTARDLELLPDATDLPVPVPRVPTHDLPTTVTD